MLESRKYAVVLEAAHICFGLGPVGRCMLSFLRALDRWASVAWDYQQSIPSVIRRGVELQLYSNHMLYELPSGCLRDGDSRMSRRPGL